MATAVLDSVNFFISTERNKGTARGDTAELNLHQIGNVHTHVGTGSDFLRIRLKQFHTHKTWHKVNRYNNSLVLWHFDGTTATDFRVVIPPGDYVDVASLWKALLDQIRLVLIANSVVTGITACTVTNTTALAAGQFSSGTIAVTGGVSTASNFYLSCPIELGESYLLLGGERGALDVVFPSLDVVIDGTDITVSSRFGVRLFTEPYVYVSVDVQAHSVATDSYKSPFIDTGVSHLIRTTILGKAAAQDGAIVFDAQTDEYFTQIDNKNLSYLRFHMHDSKGRAFPLYDSTIQTYDGTAPFSNGAEKRDQNTYGNRFFEMVCTIDIVMRLDGHPHKLISSSIEHSVPAIDTNGTHNHIYKRGRTDRGAGANVAPFVP